ncbi:putative quinol monooxygenase [Ectobacillus ponti]|uniref:Antibiotic biosynthesis monooxygenase n=1 Tax=Ectobacillus ponti TaxID=2961894 RepID=A0AA41XFS4_9BACI|nr:putative quinol monooxygenase [Ectobacillus ponti]MCP8971311.1 antibiotic biosynthesis monooxygenase [Ectobacillus ponti]
MIIIHATLRVDVTQQEVFLKEAEQLVAASRAEKGNLSYRLQKDVEQENVFTMVEVWEDLKAVAAHNVSGHFTAFTAKAREFLAAPLEVQAFEGQPLQL